MPPTEQIEAWVEEYRTAWETADPQRAAALFAEDAAYRSLVFEEPHRGRDGVAAYWTAVTAGQGDVDVRLAIPVITGLRALVEFWTTMTVETGPVTLAGAMLLDFDNNGLCVALREYWNLAEGTHQPPPEWGR